MKADRIAPLALYQEVAARLRDMIFAHELAPGSWIDEQGLAEQYGISRTPLREALKVLAAEGLVTLKPRRGCYVTEVSERDLDEVFSILALLEGECTRLMLDRADAADLQALQAIHGELEQAAAAQDIAAFFDANQRFHRFIQQLADNRWLLQVIEDLRKVIRLSRHHSLYSEGRLEQALIEHRAILDAILSGNASLAPERMRQHIGSGRQAVARIAAAKDRTAG